jgi:hypothetical protein
VQKVVRIIKGNRWFDSCINFFGVGVERQRAGFCLALKTPYRAIEEPVADKKIYKTFTYRYLIVLPGI